MKETKSEIIRLRVEPSKKAELMVLFPLVRDLTPSKREELKNLIKKWNA